MAKVALLQTDPSPNVAAIENYLHTCIESLGGMDTFATRGSRVLLKPNMGSIAHSQEGKNTDPNVIEATIRLLQAFGVRDIIIAESSIVGTDTRAAFQAMGLDRLANDYNAELRDLKNEPFVMKSVPEPLVVSSIRVSGVLDGVDTLINLPKLKAILAVPVSIGLKNLKGLIHDSEKRRFHHLGLSKALVDLGKVITPQLTIVDGILACELYEPKEANMMVAGSDVVAVDTVASAAIGLQPTEIEYLRLAQEAGIGTNDLGNIEILGDSLDKTRVEFRKAPTQIDGFSTLFPEVTIINRDACSGCVGTLCYCLKTAKARGILDKTPGGATLVIGAGTKTLPSGGPIVGLGNCTEKLHTQHFLPGCPFTAAEFCALLSNID